MTDKKKYFNVDEFHNWKKTHGKDSILPPQANFLAAANYIRGLFEKNKFSWGVMGGIEMLCLGYRREMPDLHIAYDYRDFAQLQAKLMADRRIRLPDGMNSLLPTKVLVETGPQYKDAGCTQTTFVEVDLVPPGVCGTPPADSLNSNIVLLSLKTDKAIMTFKGLNMLYLVKTLMHYCKVRGLSWDPRKDIVYLCQNYGEEVQHIRSQLNQKEVQEYFLGTPFFSRLPPSDQRRCYLILLDKEPPPMMAITPPSAHPGHKHSASALDPVRPRISSQMSSPSVNTHVSSEHLDLPLLGHSHQHAPKNGHQSHTPSTQRNSRSRYRHISAPSSRNPSPNGPQPTISSLRPKSMNLQLPHQQSAVPSPQVQTTNIQSVVGSTPQAVSSSGPVPMISGARKSMPNLHALFTGPVQPYAFTQTPLVDGNTISQKNSSMRPVSTLGAPAQQNPGQQHLKSQFGLAVDTRFGKMGPPVPITVNPKRPQARSSSYGSPLDKTALSGTHSPRLSKPKISELHAVRPERLDTSSMQFSDKSSETHVSKAYIESPSSLSEPESSLYPQPLFAPKDSPPVIELDATSQPDNYNTESLVDEIEAMTATSLLSTQPHELAGSLVFPQADSKPAIEDTKPNSRPREDSPIRALEVTTSTTTVPAQERPSNARTHSAPLTTLPASLIAGGANPHHRLSRISMSHSPPQPASAPQNTNASKYVRYYAKPPSPPSQNNRHSAYKAYNLASAPVARPEIPHAHTEPPPSHYQNPHVTKHIDAAGEYYKVHSEHVHAAPEDKGVAAPQANMANTAPLNVDSKTLAEEYRLELPGLEHLYSNDTEVASPVAK